jgi:hypothetical protein
VPTAGLSVISFGAVSNIDSITITDTLLDVPSVVQQANAAPLSTSLYVVHFSGAVSNVTAGIAVADNTMLLGHVALVKSTVLLSVSVVNMQASASNIGDHFLVAGNTISGLHVAGAGDAVNVSFAHLSSSLHGAGQAGSVINISSNLVENASLSAATSGSLYFFSATDATKVEKFVVANNTVRNATLAAASDDVACYGAAIAGDVQLLGTAQSEILVENFDVRGLQMSSAKGEGLLAAFLVTGATVTGVHTITVRNIDASHVTLAAGVGVAAYAFYTTANITLA